MKALKLIIALTVGLALSLQGFGFQGKVPPDIAKLQKQQAAAKAAFQKHKTNPKLKQAYVAATVHLGTATMMSPKLDRKVKYRNALRLYREALKVDPNNLEAKNNKELIEDIYRSMGRPIPK